ncbi:MAG: hypothetical protein AB8F26_02600 [Phycisphaerales bacterium]
MFDIAVFVLLAHQIEFSPMDGLDEGAFACEVAPSNADQACIDCMEDACEVYQKAVAGCTSQSCRLIARAEYQIDLSLCATCDPTLSSVAGAFLDVLPAFKQSWAIESLSQFE